MSEKKYHSSDPLVSAFPLSNLGICNLFSLFTVSMAHVEWVSFLGGFYMVFPFSLVVLLLRCSKGLFYLFYDDSHWIYVTAYLLNGGGGFYRCFTQYDLCVISIS